MAAPCANSIRVRLYFDYPPPSVSDCRMCWVLVDLNRCRVVADLASIIREKFHFSRRNVLSLYIEDCYLPHTESIYVVRDNDSIRVKVDNLNDLEAIRPSPVGKKRGREPEEEEGPAGNVSSVEWKNTKKKTKRKEEESQERESKQTVDKDRHKEELKKKKEKKKRKEREGKVVASAKAPSNTVPQPGKSSKKAPAPVSVNGKASAKTQNVVSSDSSDSSSEEEEAPKKAATPKPPLKTPSSAIPPAAKVTPKAKTPTATKPQPPPSSSSYETDSSSDEAVAGKASAKPPAKPPLKKTPLAKPPNTATSTPKAGAEDRNTPSRTQAVGPSSQPASSAPAQRPTANGSTQPSKKLPERPGGSDSDTSSEEEIKLVIKRPTRGVGMGMDRAPALGDPSWRGRGRGTPRGGERGGGNPRGEGRGGRGGGGDQGVGRGFFFNYEDGRQHQPSYQSDALTNNSIFIQNPAESAPKQDYSAMPLLAAPPQVGQRIAFKLLELTENYTPEVSEYKEGRLISYDPTNKQIELELLFASQAPVEPGKFDLVYQNADGSESVEYAVSRGSRVTERWESLLEPRLII